ncbi:MAG TPA: hypothetical protein VF857_07395 [Spirochaetota bacterium]
MKIDKNTRLAGLFEGNKKMTGIFSELGLHCPDCKGKAQDTIEKVAVNNGLNLQTFLDRLNQK